MDFKLLLQSYMEAWGKLAIAATKLATAVGIVCVVGYSLSIHHFPTGVSIGDSLLFTMAAACFGLVYLFLLASLIGLGVFSSPLIRFVIGAVRWMLITVLKRRVRPTTRLIKFSWLSIPFALFGVMFVIGFGQHDRGAIIQLPLISVVLYFFYSKFDEMGARIREIEALEKSVVESNEKDKLVTLGNLSMYREVQMLCLAVVVAGPLLLAGGGVIGQLINSAMRVANVKVDKAMVYVKEPYATLIPLSAEANSVVAPTEYKAFDKVSVLFQGFGKTTVLAYSLDNARQELEVPNESVIVVRRSGWFVKGV